MSEKKIFETSDGYQNFAARLGATRSGYGTPDNLVSKGNYSLS